MPRRKANYRAALDAVVTSVLHIERHRRRASERGALSTDARTNNTVYFDSQNRCNSGDDRYVGNVIRVRDRKDFPSPGCGRESAP